jgi:hypothetical protein
MDSMRLKMMKRNKICLLNYDGGIQWEIKEGEYDYQKVSLLSEEQNCACVTRGVY